MKCLAHCPVIGASLNLPLATGATLPPVASANRCACSSVPKRLRRPMLLPSRYVTSKCTFARVDLCAKWVAVEAHTLIPSFSLFAGCS